VEEVMSQSSNIGFAKIALNYLHEEKLYRYATAFGIGQRTGLFDQQGESAGLLRPVSKWSALSITRIPMGQEVAATPIQLVTAMSVIANGGRLVVPRLARQVTDGTGRVLKVYQPKIVRQVVSASAARDVAKALEQVTIDGTARNVHIQDASGAGWSYGGKTGTAQKIVDGAYSHTQFVSSFIGFMPAEDPAFVALVMVDNPHTRNYYGAEVSAPVFASIARQVAQILNIPPDLPAPGAPVLSSNSTGAAL
jgi:cell division protein FtsI (penicillin-binding protein 3)/stage V sporulation protein D (sporulation-specific penicillin-binding protein)